MLKLFSVFLSIVAFWGQAAHEQQSTVDGVRATIITKMFSPSTTAYGLVLTNNSGGSIHFDSLPDTAFQHFACTSNTIVSTTVSHWDPTDKKWIPHDTFISALPTSGTRNYRTKAYELKPGRSFCVGWWLPDESTRKIDSPLKITACTAFHDHSQCFDSPQFRLKSQPVDLRKRTRDTPR